MPIDRSTLDDLRIDRSREQKRRPRALWGIATAVLILTAVASWAVLRPARADVRVAVAEEIRGEAPSAILNGNGYVTARRQATVSSKVTGKVVEVFIEEGMEVEAGAVLARLDASIGSAVLRLAEAQAAAAASALEETRVRIEEARVDLRRAESLARQEVSSLADLDRSRAQVEALEARLVAQRDELQVAQRQVQLRRHDVDDLVIRAPFAGIVVSKNAQPGEMISPISAGGGFTRTGICTIVDMESLEIEVDVGEAYINRVAPGQPVEAVLDAYPDWKIPAHVIAVIPTADRQKATVRVRIAIDQKDARILPDMGVKVAFLGDPAPAAGRAASVRIPRAALRQEGERDIVFVVADGRAERRAITAGASTGEQLEVLSGVTAGEQVVVEGPPDLVDGARVAIAKEKDA